MGSHLPSARHFWAIYVTFLRHNESIVRPFEVFQFGVFTCLARVAEFHSSGQDHPLLPGSLGSEDWDQPAGLRAPHARHRFLRGVRWVRLAMLRLYLGVDEIRGIRDLRSPGRGRFPCKCQRTRVFHGFLGAKWVSSIHRSGLLQAETSSVLGWTNRKLGCSTEAG